MDFEINKKYKIRFTPPVITSIVGGYIAFESWGNNLSYYRIKYIGGSLTAWTHPANDTIKIEFLYPQNEWWLTDDDLVNILIDDTQIEYIEIIGLYADSVEFEHVILPNITMLETGTCEMYLYQLTGEKNIVDKTSYISLLDIVLIQANAEMNLLNPVMAYRFERSGTHYITQFNYVHIPDLERYYFVNDVTCVRTGFFVINLHVDVLYTYAGDIASQSAFITRSESGGVGTIVDNRRPLRSIRTIDFTIPTSGTFVNTTFVTDWGDAVALGTLTNCLYFLTTLNNLESSPVLAYDSSHSKTTLPTGITSLPNISTPVYFNTQSVTYLLTPAQEKYVERFAQEESETATNIISLVTFPFDLSSYKDKTISNVDITKDLKIGNKNVKDSNDANIQSFVSSLKSTGYLIVEDFKIDSPYSGYKEYLNFEPFNAYEFFIPFYGWAKMNAVDILDKRLILYYVADIYDGSATAFIYNVTNSKMVWSASCQLGVQIPLNSTNNEELNARKQANVSNLILGLIGSAISTGVGIGTMNPVAIMGGALSSSKAIASFVNNNAMMFETAQCSFSGNNTALFSGLRLVIKRSYLEPVYDVDEDKFKALQGYPANSYSLVSAHSGYVEIAEMHYTPVYQKNILLSEMNEIESIAKGGIIV